MRLPPSALLPRWQCPTKGSGGQQTYFERLLALETPPPPRALFWLPLLALAFSLWRNAERALLAFFTPLSAAPRPPLLRAFSDDDLVLPREADGLEEVDEELRDAIACSLEGCPPPSSRPL
jgi:hypothetical protein